MELQMKILHGFVGIGIIWFVAPAILTVKWFALARIKHYFQVYLDPKLVKSVASFSLFIAWETA